MELSAEDNANIELIVLTPASLETVIDDLLAMNATSWEK